MAAISLAITQFFNMLSVLFGAAEKLAVTCDNLATVAVESSGQYKDQARIERTAKLRALNAEHKTEVIAN